MAKEAKQVQKEKKSEEVLPEFKIWKKKTLENGRPWQSELANFHLRLPDTESRTGSVMTDMYDDVGALDQPHGEFIKHPEGKSLHGELFLRQTPRELLTTTEEEIRSIPGFSREKLLEFVKAKRAAERRIREFTIPFSMMNEEQNNKYEAARTEGIALTSVLNEYSIQVYIALRAKGYTEHDLTS